MIVRTLDEITGTEHDVRGDGWRARRHFTRRDGLGFSMSETTVDSGREMSLWYKHHQEACFVIEGAGKAWYGIRGWFRWLERRAYKMHVRVLLSRYRSYDRCPSCQGARLRPEALLVKVGGRSLPEAAALAGWGGQAVVVPYLRGRSTTRLIEEARRGDR